MLATPDGKGILLEDVLIRITDLDQGLYLDLRHVFPLTEVTGEGEKVPILDEDGRQKTHYTRRGVCIPASYLPQMIKILQSLLKDHASDETRPRRKNASKTRRK